MKMVDMEDAHIREATPADKEAVLKIRDDVYGGRDYLPAFYDNFMSSAYTSSFVVLYKSNFVSDSFDMFVFRCLIYTKSAL